jgi:hypothetical protein
MSQYKSTFSYLCPGLLLALFVLICPCPAADTSRREHIQKYSRFYPIELGRCLVFNLWCVVVSCLCDRVLLRDCPSLSLHLCLSLC